MSLLVVKNQSTKLRNPKDFIINIKNNMIYTLNLTINIEFLK